MHPPPAETLRGCTAPRAGDLNSDFLLIILKRLLTRRHDLKIVLMSATLNADLFAKYFGGCPKIEVPGAHEIVRACVCVCVCVCVL